MDSIRARVAGDDVITSGVLISHEEQSVEIFPFSDDPKYRMEVEIQYRTKTRKKEVVVYPTADGAKVVFFDSFEDSIGFASNPVSLAEDDEHEFLLTLAVLPIGSLKEHANVIHYTIIRKIRA